MKTAIKRVIAALAVFGALSALCYSCAPVNASAAYTAIDEPMVEYLVEWMNETYDLYYGQIVPDTIVQDLYADAYAISMYVSRALSAAYEPDFNSAVHTLITGFYLDAQNEIHVTTFYVSRATKQVQQRFLIAASDEHYCILQGNTPIGQNNVTGYACQFLGTGDTTAHSWALGEYHGNSSGYYRAGFTVLNDTGDSYTTNSRDFAVGVDLSRPAQLCTAFPPSDYVTWGGYLPIPQSGGETVRIEQAYHPVNSTDFTADDENFRNIINNYIVENYPNSTFVVPEEMPVETLPNDEYSGLPAGWNEINPVPLPDIQTPSAPLTDAEMEDAHNWLTDFSFWASVQTGLAFWFAAAAHVAEINETLTGILLGVSLLSVLGYVLWRWGI